MVHGTAYILNIIEMLILIWYLDLPKWTSKLLHTRFHLSLSSVMCFWGLIFFQCCGVEVLLTRGRITLELGEIFTRWVNSMPHPVPIKLSSMPLWAICTAAITDVRLWHVLLMWTSQSAQTTILELARKVRSKNLEHWIARERSGKWMDLILANSNITSKWEYRLCPCFWKLL
jgi:hypothetical protein